MLFPLIIPEKAGSPPLPGLSHPAEASGASLCSHLTGSSSQDLPTLESLLEASLAPKAPNSEKAGVLEHQRISTNDKCLFWTASQGAGERPWPISLNPHHCQTQVRADGLERGRMAGYHPGCIIQTTGHAVDKDFTASASGPNSMPADKTESAELPFFLGTTVLLVSAGPLG